jgi:hypothetical protein
MFGRLAVLIILNSLDSNISFRIQRINFPHHALNHCDCVPYSRLHRGHGRSI